MKIWVTVLVLFLLSGCLVSTPDPLGDEYAQINSDDWYGTWIGESGSAVITVSDETSGIINIGMIEEKDNQLALDVTQMELRMLGDYLIGNTKFHDQYVWHLVYKKQNTIVLIPANHTLFEELVKSGELPGRIEEFHKVSLDALQEDDITYLKNLSQRELFNYKERIVLKRHTKTI